MTILINKNYMCLREKIEIKNDNRSKLKFFNKLINLVKYEC